jgi:hypothetical protein
MNQITKAQAIAIFQSRVWETWTNKQVVDFQLYQERLAVDWTRFQMAVEAMLGRPVWTHEFADDQRLKDEYEGRHGKPTFEEIMALIPEDKLIVVVSE